MRNTFDYINRIGLFIVCIGVIATGWGQHKTNSTEKDNHSFTHIAATKAKEVKERAIDHSVLNKIKKDNAFWYANIKPVRSQPDGKLPFWLQLVSQSWFRLLIWLVIAGGFTAVLIWYLASLNVHLFKKSPKSLAAISAVEEAEDIFRIDYDWEIANAVQQQNYRLAIRLHYLQLLKKLSQQNIIQHHSGLTNTEYIQQLSATSYYRSFFRLTRHFEYSWYGQMAISSTVFAAVQHDFETFNQQLGS